jgi:protease-4
MSDANREQLTVIANSVWDNIVEDVSDSRHLSKEKLNELADKVLMFHPATEAVTSGMIDTLIYKNDVRDYLKKMVGIDKDDNLPLLGVSEMVNVNRNVPKDKSGNIIAVYYATGEIDGTSVVNTGSSSGINSEKVISDLRKLKEDKDVKAVVFRVNSPGGSAYGSEQIWYAIKQLKEEKPVIVSMGDYAASGGYYISCGSDLIVAEPTTLTGSIGIFGLIPNAQKLKEKFGINIQAVKTNENAGIQGTEMLTRPMTESEKGLMQMYVNNGYDLFTTRVADGRNLSKTRVDEIGQGRVWTGEDAKELGLVDELGGIDKAISIAIEKAGIEKYTLLTYPEEESILSKLMNSSPSKYVRSSLLKSKFGDLYYQYEYVNNFSINDMLQMRMPYELDIH